MKKTLTHTLLYLLIILLIPYSYFTWQAKQGVDTFLLLHPLDGDFEYNWLWIDLDGKISLQNISFYQDTNDPVFTAEKIEIVLSSPFELLDAKSHITYKEYPSNIIVNLVNAQSTQSAKFFSLFGVDYEPEHLSFFYPEQCLEIIDKELPVLHFDISSLFVIQRTADKSLVNFSFKSKKLANLNGKFIINNFSGQYDNASFLSDLVLDFSELSWLQQNTKKCFQALNLKGLKFDQSFNQFIKQSAKRNNLLLADELAEAYVSFAFIPKRVRLEFNLQEGKTFSQIPLLPVYDYQQKTGLSIQLNDKKLSSIFQAYDYISAVEEKNKAQPVEEKHQPAKEIYLSLNRRALIPHLGAKIEIRLYNKKVVIGYLEMANNHSVKIIQLKYKGKSILPFEFKNIKSILLLRPAG